MDNHADDCPCINCETRREVKAFAAIREIHQQGGTPWELFSKNAPPPRRQELVPRTDVEQTEYENTLRKEATLFSLAALSLPKKRGAKKKNTQTINRFYEVNLLIQEGKLKTEAYKLVAEKNFKSVDTIRREYERNAKKFEQNNKRIRKRKQTGEND